MEGLGKGVARLSAEAEKVLALPEPSPAAPTLRSELELTLGKVEQVRSLSAFYLEKGVCLSAAGGGDRGVLSRAGGCGQADGPGDAATRRVR